MPHCKLKNCPYDRDGKCVENQLPNCPNLVAGDFANLANLELAAKTGLEPAPAPTHETVYSGRKMSAAEAAPIFQSNPFVVVLGGVVESGKTTLLARIFEMFQSGDIKGFGFMTSRTPVEFDKLSWHATMECGGATPATENTHRPENNLFLHLRIRPEEGVRIPIDLLFSDIPGEIFPEAIAEAKVCRELQALKRADHLVLFLDAGMLNDLANRYDHAGKVFSFLKQALYTGQVGQNTVVHLVISKSDLLPGDATGEILKFTQSTERTFHRQFVSRVGGLHVWRLAARPGEKMEPTLSTINEMFKIWTTRATPHAGATSIRPLRSNINRDFCRFGL